MLPEMRYKQLQHKHNCIKYARTICDTLCNKKTRGYPNGKANTKTSQPFVSFCDVVSTSESQITTCNPWIRVVI
jgi:hypothetical protein